MNSFYSLQRYEFLFYSGTILLMNVFVKCHNECNYESVIFPLYMPFVIERKRKPVVDCLENGSQWTRNNKMTRNEPTYTLLPCNWMDDDRIHRSTGLKKPDKRPMEVRIFNNYWPQLPNYSYICASSLN